jgi:molecular chaperone GrpE
MSRDKNESSDFESENDKSEQLSECTADELIAKVAEAEQKATQYWERILRMQAENENALRRAERDIANAHKFALEKFVGELLPIIDSLELSIVNTSDELQASAAPVIEGVQLTLKMFHSALDKFGVKQVNPINQPFDPEFQQAISMQQDPSLKPGTVISVLQKGYTLNNRLLRPALVAVSQA